MAEQAPAVQEPRGKGKSTRSRRIVRGLAWCVAAIIVLVLLAPTLITWLPTERIVESQANNLLRGKLEVSGIKVGWMSPLRIGKVALRESKDANAPVVFYAEDFSVETGLIGNIFEDDRLGRVRLGAVAVDVTRRKDGTISIMDALPAGGTDAEPKQPFELDVRKYLPKRDLPIPSLDAAVEAIHVTYRDEALTTGPITIKFDGGVAARWRGGATPLNTSIGGTMAVDGRSAPILLLAEVKDWTDGTALKLDRATATLRIHPAKDDRHPALVEVATALDGEGGVAAEFTLRPDQLPPAMTLLPPGMELPGASGIASAKFKMSRVGGNAAVEFNAKTSPVVLADFGRDGRDWAFPESQLAISAVVNAQTLDRTSILARIDSPFVSLQAQEKKQATGEYHADLSGNIRFGGLTRLATGLRFMPDIVPVLDAEVELRGSGVYTDTRPVSGSLSLDWRGQYVEWARLPDTPQFGMLCSNGMDLRPTSFTARISADPGADGATRVAISGGGELFSLDGAGTYRSREDAQVRLSYWADFKTIADFVSEQVKLPFPFSLAGIANGSLDASIDGLNLRQNGRISIEGLALASPLMPTGEVVDDPVMNWGATTRLEAPFATRGGLNVESGFGRLQGGGRYDPVAGHTARMSGTLLLEPVLALLPEGTVPPPETMTLGGAVDGSVELAAQSASHYEISASVGSGENFALGAMNDALALRNFNAGTSITLAQDANGNLKVDATALSASLEDFLSLGGTAVYTRRGNLHAVESRQHVELDAEKLATFVQPLLEVRELGQLAMAGVITQDFSLKGAFETSGEGVVFRSPLEITSATKSEGVQALFTNALTEVSAAAEGLSLNIALRAPSMDNMRVVIAPLAMNAFQLSTPQAEIVLPPCEAAVELDCSPAARTLDLTNLRINVPGALTASLKGKSDLNKGEHSFVGEVEATDASRFLVKMAGTATDSPPLLSGALTGKFSAMANTSAPSAEGALLGFVYKAEANAEWKDVAVHYGEYAATGLQGKIDFKSDGNETRLRSQAEVASVTTASQPTPLVHNVTLDSALFYDRSGTFFLRNFEVLNKDTATNFYLRGRIGNIPELIASLPVEKTPEALTNWFLGVPFDVYTGAKQDLVDLPMPADAMKVSSGDVDFAFHLQNDPQRGIEVNLTELTELLSFSMPGLLDVKNVNGSLPVTRALAIGKADPLPLEPQQGRFSIDDIAITHPRLTGRMTNTIVTADTAARRMGASVLCEQFFGGPATAAITMSTEAGDPVLAMDFTATGLDGAAYMPTLARRPLADRTANCYGSLRLVLAEGQQVNGLLERLLLRVEFTNMGSEILRETLRAMDASGSSPGIQATLASLRFSRPISMALEVRGGLMNLTMTMTTPAGVIYTIPVFERTNVASLLEGRVDPAMNEQLGMLRQAALLVMAQHVDDLMALAGTKGESP
ncbi:hypothetical protein IT570_12060 [Candidatus Sumerlaeota bacterium]|nr:hypothetical protein [Candidatus Sumerlaeota bacterium]